MKLMIDIDEDVYTRLFDNGIQDNEIAVDDICEMARALRIGTSIPDNTNGDVIKRVLYEKAIITEFIHDVNISVNNKVIGQFDMEWWRSPYKRGETE